MLPLFEDWPLPIVTVRVFGLLPLIAFLTGILFTLKMLAPSVRCLAGTFILNDSLPFVREGRVKALAITSAKRSELLPDVPTLSESVMPDFESGAWQGIVAPTGTPEAIIERLNKEIHEALASDMVRDQLAKQGTQILGNSPAEYQKYISDETVRWGDVIRAAGVTVN